MAAVLVVYATVEGQSKKIATRIAADIRNAGFEATLADARRCLGITPPDYDGVVVVASVHMGRHPRSVERFVHEHCSWLQSRPSAFLAVSL
jgi:menaquinone-dependent protoporphyrinogen oxidase